VATTNAGGVLSRVTYDGTYTLDADCTGAAVTRTTEGAEAHYDMAVRDDGAEFGFVQTDPEVVAAAFERHRTSSDDPCSLDTLKGNYIFGSKGFERMGDMWVPFATAGREVYDGEGTITGKDTFNTNGVVLRETYDAVYTVDSDCHAVYTDDDDPTNPYEFYLDPTGEEFAAIATGVGRVTAVYARR
jgi:hypothetical protein